MKITKRELQNMVQLLVEESMDSGVQIIEEAWAVEIQNAGATPPIKKDEVFKAVSENHAIDLSGQNHAEWILNQILVDGEYEVFLHLPDEKSFKNNAKAELHNDVIGKGNDKKIEETAEEIAEYFDEFSTHDAESILIMATPEGDYIDSFGMGEDSGTTAKDIARSIAENTPDKPFVAWDLNNDKKANELDEVRAERAIEGKRSDIDPSVMAGFLTKLLLMVRNGDFKSDKTVQTMKSELLKPQDAFENLRYIDLDSADLATIFKLIGGAFPTVKKPAVESVPDFMANVFRDNPAMKTAAKEWSENNNTLLTQE